MTFDVYEHPEIPGCDPRVTIDNHTKNMPHVEGYQQKAKNNIQEPHTALEGIIQTSCEASWKTDRTSMLRELAR